MGLLYLLLVRLRIYRPLKFESDVMAVIESEQQEDGSDRIRVCGRWVASIRKWGAYDFACRQPLTSRGMFARCAMRLERHTFSATNISVKVGLTADWILFRGLFLLMDFNAVWRENAVVRTLSLKEDATCRLFIFSWRFCNNISCDEWAWKENF